MNLSIIIPTYNRFDSLRLCIKKIQEQTLDKANFEVIIIDDGSTEEGYRNLSKILSSSGLNQRYFKQTNSGPAKARNFGISVAKNDVLVFMGDDMILDENCLKIHFAFHEENPAAENALLGKVILPKDDKFKNDDFLQWLDGTPLQFDFKSIKTGEIVDYTHFYTSNISVKKSLLLHNGIFNEDFPAAAGEDTELGYRLEKSGLKLLYNELAVAEHNHYVNLKDYEKRMFQAGKSSRMIVNLHPELKNKFEIKNKPIREAKFQLKGVLGIIGVVLNIKKIKEFGWSYKLISAYKSGYKY